LKESFRDDQYRVASGLTLGGSGRLGRELRMVFSRAGILHILAVSGLHVGFVAAFLGFLLLSIPIDYRLKIFIIICGLMLYAGVTGFRPSVCRAAFMAVLLGLAMILQRKVDHIHVINITAIAFLIASPLLIFDVGAQLSFAAVYGILYLYPKIDLKFITRVRPRFLKILFAPMAVSFSAQIFVAPFIIYYFHRLPVYAVLTNFVIIPIASMIIFLLFLSFFAGALCFALAKIITVPVSLLIAALIALSKFFASMPLSSISPVVSPLITFPFYLLVWAKARKAVIWLILAIVLVFTLSSSVDCLTVCTVGEGVLITTPAGENILVSGGKYAPQRILLARQGISELDYLIAPSKILPVVQEYVSLPDKMHFKNLSCDDLVIHITNRVGIEFRGEVVEFDWGRRKGLQEPGRVTYILSNGEEKYTIQGSLYGSIIEQMVLDSKIVLCRIGLLF
jgi:competence protein ComEC